MHAQYDVAVVGGGILGLAHAFEARRRGCSVALFEADAHCVGASVRNFGFVTVSGQRPGRTWERARYSRDVWEALCGQAGIAVAHRGAWIVCRRPEAAAVAAAFAATSMGRECSLYPPARFEDLRREVPGLDALETRGAHGLLFSPHELRVQSSLALPLLGRWLQAQGAELFYGCGVRHVEGGTVQTTRGAVRARAVILCAGAQLQGIAAPAWKSLPIELCTLQMMRIAAPAGWRLPGSILTDESLVRYPGWSGLPECQALLERIGAEDPETLEQGVHLIAVQDADGSLVVGDSHRYGPAEFIGAHADIEQSILRLVRRTLRLPEPRVLERWTGIYPRLEQQDAVSARIDERCVAVLVTSGTGASTAFGIARDTFEEHFADVQPA